MIDHPKKLLSSAFLYTCRGIILLVGLSLCACRGGKPTSSIRTVVPSPTATFTEQARLLQSSTTPTIQAASPYANTPTPTRQHELSQSTPTSSGLTASATATVPAATQIPTKTPGFTPTATISSTLSRLTICLATEPATLFRYSVQSYETDAILDAIQEGPVDYRTYLYYPVLFEDLPTLENGDAFTQTIRVHTNDRYVDANGNPAYWMRTEKKMEQWVVVFHLKEGLLWSDGTPLTADDFRFGYEIARASANSSSPYTYLAERTASFTAPDSTTLRWVGLPGYTDPDYSTHFFPPVSRRAYGSLNTEQMMTDAQINTSPLGWGPFRIVSWTPGDRIRLERNPYYFRAAEGLPHLQEVIFRFVPQQQIMAALSNGECDVGARDYDWEAQIDTLRVAQAAGTLAPQFVKSGFFEHLDFDLQPSDERTAFFAEQGARQAVAYCLDRQAIADQVLPGLSGVPDSFLPPDHPFYNSQVTRYAYDPARGRALLSAAGWADHDGDGFLDRNGIIFSVSLYARDLDLPARTAPLIAQQLKDNCGLNVTVETHNRSELFSAYPEGLVSGRRFDLAEFYWSTSAGWQTCEVFESNQIPDDDHPNGINYTGYANSNYDAACQAGNSPLSLEQRKVSYQEAQAIFANDLPSLPLYWRLLISVARPNVIGLDLDPTTATEFWNLEQMRIGP